MSGTPVAYVLALLAAFGFGLGAVLQQKGTLEAPAGENDPRFLAQILRRPVWLAGAGCMAVGWVVQAIALGRGPLIVVQSLTALSMVIALPLGIRITSQQVSRRVWMGALAVVAGIILFLSAGVPKAGTSQPSASVWWTAGFCALVAVLALAGVGRRHRGAARALLFGSAAGIDFGLQASVTKVFVKLVGLGLGTLLSSWTTYVLIVSALAGFALQQSALKTGVLAPALASSNAVTLFASVVFGLTVFGETLAHGGGRLIPALIGLAAALAGIMLLAGAQPPQQASLRPVPGR
jgi:drug/metabolite transporter (DMT)-like permease